MSKESNWLETVKGLVAKTPTLQPPNVTCGSSSEREWWPPYVVSEGPKKDK